MRIAVITPDGLVENVIIAEADFAIEGRTLVPTDEAGPGWTYDGATFSPPPGAA